MLRPLRVVVALALALPLVVTSRGLPAGAADRELPPALANDLRRQELLHRAWPDDGVPGSILVTATTPAAASAIAERESGLTIGDRSVLLHVAPGTEGAAAARIVARGGALAVEPDRVRELARVPNDPGYVDQWAHTMSRTPTAWDITTGDAAVTVAVLDTGVDGDHVDLAENLVEQVDLSSGRARVRPLGSDNDTCDVGHGTFVAGIVGAAGDNATGIAGVAWDVSIVDVALTSRASRCGILDSAIIAGLDYVTDESRVDGPVDIVNLSLGGIAESCPTSLQSALDDAREAGTFVIAAAGNEQGLVDDPISIPASCDGVLSVGAVGQGGEVASYSNINDHVDIAAPGGDSAVGRGIVSTAAGGDYDEFEGTSFAAPYVAGVAALLRSVEPALTPDDLESILEATATDRGDTGRDPSYGWGIVDAGAALAAASGDVDPPEDDPGFPVRAVLSNIERVKASGTTTDPIRQAAALSEFTFEPVQALHAVIARADDFADALAGSALGFGVGPLLFTTPTGPLAGPTRVELQRVLDTGGTVYLLGGTAALPPTLEGELRDLGYVPVRLAGPTRQETAVAVATALDDFLTSNEFVPPSFGIVATAFNWPDAVAVGAMGAWFGVPILVTSPDRLDAPVAEYLGTRSWDRIYVVGGTAAITEDVRRTIRDASGVASGNVPRLAGVNRSATAVAVGQEFEDLYSEQFQLVFGAPSVPNIVVGVNLRRADGFAHVLSASTLAGSVAGVFLPIEGEGGTEIDEAAQFYACRFPAFGVVIGGSDVVADATATLMDELMRGEAPICST